MASIFRPTYTDKKTGKARKLRRWYVKYRDADGVVRRVAGYTDKEATKQLAARLERGAARGREGMTDPFEAHHKRPLAEHVEDYRRYLLAKGDAEETAHKMSARCRAVLEGCGFAFIPDLSASAVAEFLHRLRLAPARPDLPPGQEWFSKAEVVALLGINRDGFPLLLRRANLHGTARGNGKARRYPRAAVEALQARHCRGLSPSTSNGYLTAVKGFTRWLVRDRRTGADPLTVLSRVNANADVRRMRRALAVEELQTLLNAAAGSTAIFRGLTGHDRSLLYAVGMATGFRAGELASLCPESFDLAGEPPTATVRAAYSKNRRTSVQPLPPDVAFALRDYLDGRPAGAPLWPGSWAGDAADMLRLDLEAAGIPFADAESRICDFHALRHSYITLLQRSGVHPKLAQELARHSDIRLTMNVYTHAHLHDLAGAVEVLPTLLPTGLKREAGALKATGTDGGPVPRHCPQHCPDGDAGRDSLSAAETLTRADGGTGGCRNLSPLSGLDADCGQMRAGERSGPSRTRTCNPGIMSSAL